MRRFAEPGDGSCANRVGKYQMAVEADFGASPTEPNRRQWGDTLERDERPRFRPMKIPVPKRKDFEAFVEAVSRERPRPELSDQD